MSVPIRSPFDRPRWTEQDARAALFALASSLPFAALERSGKSVRQFADEHRLDPRPHDVGPIAMEVMAFDSQLS